MESRTCEAHPDGRSAVPNHKAMAYICTMRVWHNARLLTPTPIDRGVLAAEGARIAYAGPAADAPQFAGRRAHRLRGPLDHARADRLPHAPGLCRRSRRMNSSCDSNGATYEEIAACRRRHPLHGQGDPRCELEQLIAATRPRLDALIAEGINNDRDQVRLRTDAGGRDQDAARGAGAGRQGQCQRTTFLGAHALPPEFAGAQDGYIDRRLRQMIRSRAGKTGGRGRRFLRNHRLFP